MKYLCVLIAGTFYLLLQSTAAAALTTLEWRVSDADLIVDAKVLARHIPDPREPNDSGVQLGYRCRFQVLETLKGEPAKEITAYIQGLDFDHDEGTLNHEFLIFLMYGKRLQEAEESPPDQQWWIGDKDLVTRLNQYEPIKLDDLENPPSVYTLDTRELKDRASILAAVRRMVSDEPPGHSKGVEVQWAPLTDVYSGDARIILPLDSRLERLARLGTEYPNTTPTPWGPPELGLFRSAENTAILRSALLDDNQYSRDESDRDATCVFTLRGSAAAVLKSWDEPTDNVEIVLPDDRYKPIANSILVAGAAICALAVLLRRIRVPVRVTLACMLPLIVVAIWMRSHSRSMDLMLELPQKQIWLSAHKGWFQFGFQSRTPSIVTRLQYDRDLPQELYTWRPLARTPIQARGFQFATFEQGEMDEIFEPDDAHTAYDRLGISVIHIVKAVTTAGELRKMIIYPGWLLILTLSPAVIILRRKMAAWRRTRRGLCAQCGYDLRTSPTVCPECGAKSVRRWAHVYLTAHRSGPIGLLALTCFPKFKSDARSRR